MLISSFITSKLDYCNVALVGLTRCDLDRLQSVINAAARLTVGAQHYDHISPLSDALTAADTRQVTLLGLLDMSSHVCYC